MFWCKIFEIKDEVLVAICDLELLGKKISKDPEIKITRHFYGGERIGKEEALAILKKATIGNLFGKKIIKLALEEKLISEENIMYIGEIPHAQFVK